MSAAARTADLCDHAAAGEDHAGEGLVQESSEFGIVQRDSCDCNPRFGEGFVLESEGSREFLDVISGE